MVAHAIRSLVVTICFLSIASVQAQNESLVGTQVMTIKWDTKFKEGTAIVFESELGEVYTVEQVNGSWLWLVGEGRKGWVKRSDVVPYAEAIDYFTAQISQNPSSTNYYNRANAWKAKGELDIALGDYSEAIRRDPTSAAIYNGRGNLWEAKGDYDKAVADYNEAIRLNPQLAWAYNNRGSAWDSKGDYDKAIADYHEAIRLDPKYAMAYNNIGWLRATAADEKFRDGAEAVKYATKACELNDYRDWSHLDTLAAAYATNGEFDKAVETIKKTQAIATQTIASADQQKYLQDRLADYEAKRPYIVKPK